MMELNKLEELARAALSLPSPISVADEDAAMKALHDWLPADTVLELIALIRKQEAEIADARKGAPAVDLSGLAIAYTHSNSSTGDRQAVWLDDVRALLSAAPAEQIPDQTGDIFDLIREWAHLPEVQRHDAARKIIGSVNQSYMAGVRDTRELLAAEAPSKPAAPKDTPESMADSNARFAIDGAIQYGRENRNKPPSDDHWLMEYWLIGQQLRELGKTGWDNRTPLDPAEKTALDAAAHAGNPSSDDEHIRIELMRAATNCGHGIDSEEITLNRDPRQDGNALHQLANRLLAAYRVLATPHPEPSNQGDAAIPSGYTTRENLDAIKSGCSPVHLYGPDCREFADVALFEHAAASVSAQTGMPAAETPSGPVTWTPGDEQRLDTALTGFFGAPAATMDTLETAYTYKVNGVEREAVWRDDAAADKARAVAGVLDVLAEQKEEASKREGDWWRGYGAALHWIGKQIEGDKNDG